MKSPACDCQTPTILPLAGGMVSSLLETMGCEALDNLVLPIGEEMMGDHELAQLTGILYCCGTATPAARHLSLSEALLTIFDNVKRGDTPAGLQREK